MSLVPKVYVFSFLLICLVPSVCSKLKLSFVLAEVTSIEWTAVTMSEEEEDLILRMYKLVGDRLNSMCALLLTVSLFGLEFT